MVSQLAHTDTRNTEFYLIKVVYAGSLVGVKRIGIEMFGSD